MAKTNDLTLSNFQSISQRNNSPRTGQPSISITPLPGRGTPSGSKPNPSPQQSPQAALKPGQPTSQGKSGFVICEICDGYIKDLEQLRNHMQWIHKVLNKVSFYIWDNATIFQIIYPNVCEHGQTLSSRTKPGVSLPL